MPVLYHAPESRSDTIATLVRMLKADIDISEVSIPRQDGSGAPDPDNPHPEKKVPYLVDGAERLRERGAIIVYLTDAYPDAKLGPLPGEAGRGAYLSWLFYYQGVMEPVIILHWAQLSHPAFTASLRDLDTVTAHLAEALDQGPYLLGERFTAADMLCSSPYHWFPDLIPDTPSIRSWVARCAERMQLTPAPRPPDDRTGGRLQRCSPAGQADSLRHFCSQHKRKERWSVPRVRFQRSRGNRASGGLVRGPIIFVSQGEGRRQVPHSLIPEKENDHEDSDGTHIA